MLVLIGVGIGVPVVPLRGAFREDIVVRSSSSDPVSLVGASFVLLIVAVVAGYSAGATRDEGGSPGGS